MGALKFRVLLDSEQNTEIFRDILIDEHENLEVFYHSIIASFGFEGGQMASFYLSNDDWDKGTEFSLMDLSYESDQSQDEALVMSSVILADQLEAADQKLILVHDFLRMWIFLIELIERTDQEISEPEVLLSIGLAPAEDSKEMQFDLEDDFADFSDDEDADDEFDSDFEDGYNEEDYGSFDEQDY